MPSPARVPEQRSRRPAPPVAGSRRTPAVSLGCRVVAHAPYGSRSARLVWGIANRMGVALDFLSDLAVLCFASWTLFAYLGMITGGTVSVLTVLWLLTTPVLAAFLLLLRFRPAPELAETRNSGPVRPVQSGTPPPARQLRLYAVAVAAGLVAGVLAAYPGDLPWGVVWMPALIAAVATVLADKLRSRGNGVLAAANGWAAEVFAASVGVVFALLSLFVNRERNPWVPPRTPR